MLAGYLKKAFVNGGYSLYFEKEMHVVFVFDFTTSAVLMNAMWRD